MSKKLEGNEGKVSTLFSYFVRRAAPRNRALIVYKKSLKLSNCGLSVRLTLCLLSDLVVEDAYTPKSAPIFIYTYYKMLPLYKQFLSTVYAEFSLIDFARFVCSAASLTEASIYHWA